MKNLDFRKYYLILVSIIVLCIQVHSQNGTWTLIDSLPTPRATMMQVCVVGGIIYFIGGTSGAPSFPDLAANESYEPLTNTWDTLAPMPTPRGFLTTAVVNDTIYAICGGFPSNPKSTLEAYDPITNSWLTKADMLSPRAEMQAGVVNRIIYVMPVAFETRNCMAYNPATNEWTKKSMRSEIGGPVSVTVYNDLVYTFGGTASPPDQFFQQYMLITRKQIHG